MSKLIFVTGASGFLASQIIYQLIQDGYRVRATARPRKVEALKDLYKTNPSVEIVEVADIADDQFPEALKGVDAVIHTASPLPERESVENLLKIAIEGTLNVLRQAEKIGITKFIVTSSMASVTGFSEVKGTPYRADQWNPITKAEATLDNPIASYEVSKKYAELAVWEWAEAHPHVDITTINPPFVYGPFPPLSLPVSADISAMSTNSFIYGLLSPTGAYPLGPGYIDLRDVARAHVGALSAPASASAAGRKRIIFASPFGVSLKEAVEIVRKERPEISGRLIRTLPVPEFPYDRYDIDFDRIQEVTGLKKGDFHTLKQTLLDTIDSLLQVETGWKET